jgi:phage terminase large subunit
VPGVSLKPYKPLPTMIGFHQSDAEMRALVGPVGSGKTTAAIMEVGLLLPRHLARTYGITDTRWVIVRKTYRELMDTTFASVQDWMPFMEWQAAKMTGIINYPPSVACNYPLRIELIFRSCNRPEDMEKFKSLEVTGYWIEEAVEVHEEIKRMLKTRIGRYPQRSSVRFGIETTNPCDVEHQIYWEHNWVPTGPDWETYRTTRIQDLIRDGATKEEAEKQYPVTADPNHLEKDATGRFTPWTIPGPRPKKKPTGKYLGWWQPPHENDANLRPGYYDALMEDYGNNPEWLNMYVYGRPGVRVLGRVVYANFRESIHVYRGSMTDPFLHSNGTPLYFGWDNSGNAPACIVAQFISPLSIQILAEFYSDREGITDFTRKVLSQLEEMFPGYVQGTHYGDPAGGARYSKGTGGMTSNAQLQYEEFGIVVIPSEQGIQARIQSVDQMLARNGGILIDPRCTRLINGFIGGYVYPEKVGVQNEFLQQPMKNSFSHVHDALQYLCAKLFTVRKRQDQEIELRNLMTLDKIRELVAESDEAGYDEKRWGGFRW